MGVLKTILLRGAEDVGSMGFRLISSFGFITPGLGGSVLALFAGPEAARSLKFLAGNIFVSFESEVKTPNGDFLGSVGGCSVNGLSKLTHHLEKSGFY